MVNPFIFLWIALFTLLMAIPFGIAIVYVFISVRQYMIGDKENNAEKRNGARKSFLIALAGLLLTILAYTYFIQFL